MYERIVSLQFPSEQCARFSAPDDVIKNLRALSVCDDRIDPVGCGKLCGLEFCAHTAGTSSGAGSSSERVDALINGINLFL